MRLCLIVAYMVIVHVAEVRGSDRLAIVAVALLALAGLLPALRRAPALFLIAAIATGTALSLYAGALARVFLLLPPVVANGALAWLFGRTLYRGHTPLVEQFIRVLHGNPGVVDAAILAYARRVTLWWTGLFCFNATLCLVLALVAVPGGLLAQCGMKPPVSVPTLAWTLYSDVGCYLLTGLLFVVEYAIRRRRFPQQPYRNLADFLSRALAAGPAILQGAGRRGPGVKTGQP